MKTKILIFLFFLLALSFNMKGQIIKGILLTEQGKTIPFVNISLSKEILSTIGWTTNIEGTFQMSKSFFNNTDSITFSCIGFISKKICVSDFSTKTENKIVLNEKQYSISEVKIEASKKKKIITLGTYKNNTDAGCIYQYGSTGFLVAIFIENPMQKVGLLKEIKIKLIKNNHSTLPVRIHIYDVNEPDAGPQNELLNKSVLARPKHAQSRWISADLLKHNIIFPKEGLFVGIEFLPTENLVLDSDNGITIDTDNPNLIALQLGRLKSPLDCVTWINDSHKKKQKTKNGWYFGGKEGNFHPAVGPTNLIMGADIIFFKD